MSVVEELQAAIDQFNLVNAKLKTYDVDYAHKIRVPKQEEE